MPKQVQPRKSLACKPCQSLKVKCLPSEHSDICQKCTRSGAECVFKDPKPRRKSDKPDSRTRLAALESKLEDLIARVGNQSTSGDSGGQDDSVSPGESANQTESRTFKDTPSAASSTNQLPIPAYQARDQPHFAAGGHGHPYPSESSFARFPSGGATPEALISGGFLSAEDVGGYLARFREMSWFFPFVAMPHDVNVYTMLRDRPLALHAALAVATSSQVHLQKALEKSFKELILRKLVLEVEKSIDLLQSILICAAWGHFFSIPKRDQSYQLLQMAFALCVDLGLNVTPEVAMQKKVGLHLDHYQPSGDDDQDRLWSRDARCAFLGCYHLSSMNAWISAKPKTLEYSEYVLKCAQSISGNPEYTTDELILPLIQIQAIGDEYHQVLRVNRDQVHSQTRLDRIGAHARSFQKQIDDLKSTLTPTTASSTFFFIDMEFF